MNYFGKIFTAAVTFVLCCTNIFAQEQNPADTAASSKPAFPENAPMMRQDGAQKLYYIRDINIHGVQYLNSDILKSSAGLIAQQLHRQCHFAPVEPAVFLRREDRSRDRGRQPRP